MAISLNHTIVVARDKENTARFLTEMLGLQAHLRVGHFAIVRVGETSLDFVETEGPHRTAALRLSRQRNGVRRDIQPHSRTPVAVLGRPVSPRAEQHQHL